MEKSRAFTLGELLIVATVFIITFILLTPFVNKIKERAHVIRCSNHMSLISLALHAYAADHGEAFPAALKELYPKYVKEERMFNCPASGSAGTADNSDYEYIGGLTESSPPTEAMLYDKTGNHGALGRNIVRVNGSVEWSRNTEGKPR